MSKPVLIKCDRSTCERLKLVFAEETELCFFGSNAGVTCLPYFTQDGTDCRRCIEENVEWIITDDPETEE